MAWDAARKKRHPPMTDADYIERVKTKTTIDANGCWVWSGGVSSKGYGEFSYHNRKMRTHRFSFQFFRGEVPKGKMVCHSCDNRRCWNPDHLWLGTNRENMVDCSRKGRAWKQQNTTCKRGHEYTPETVRLLDMGMTKKRVCKVCARINMRIRAGWPTDLAESLPPVKSGLDRNGQAVNPQRFRKY